SAAPSPIQATRLHSTGKAACDLEQVSRVFPRIDAEAENRIVARPFALAMELIRCNPEERIEPIRRACDLREQLKQPIHPLHVRDLVRDNDTQALVRPILRRSR